MPSSNSGYVKRVAEHLLRGDMSEASQLLDAIETEQVGTHENPANNKKMLFHSLVQTCANARDPIAASWCLERMIREGLHPCIATMNAVIGACAKTGRLGQASTWWGQLEQMELKPNNFTYNIMINACAQARKPAKAEGWVIRMQQDGFRPCKISFNTVIDAFAKTGKVDRAEGWFQRMQEMGVEADDVIYNSLINACAQAGKPAKAAQWFEEMQNHRFKADPKTYNALISACAKAGAQQKAELWFRQMEADGCRVDVITFGSLMHACARAGNVQRTEFWVEEMQRRGLEPNLVCFNTVLHACAQAGDTTSAAKWFDTISASGTAPNKISYNSMIAVYARAGDLKAAELWLGNMVRYGLHPDHITYVTLLRDKQHTKPKGPEFIAASQWAYSAIVRAHMAAGNIKQLKHWTTQMARDSVTLSQEVLAECARVAAEPVCSSAAAAQMLLRSAGIAAEISDTNKGAQGHADSPLGGLSPTSTAVHALGHRSGLGQMATKGGHPRRPRRHVPAASAASSQSPEALPLPDFWVGASSSFWPSVRAPGSAGSCQELVHDLPTEPLHEGHGSCPGPGMVVLAGGVTIERLRL